MAEPELQTNQPAKQPDETPQHHPIIAGLLQLTCLIIGGGLAWYDLRVPGSEVPMFVYGYLLAVLAVTNERLFSKLNPWSK